MAGNAAQRYVQSDIFEGLFLAIPYIEVADS